MSEDDGRSTLEERELLLADVKELPDEDAEEERDEELDLGLNDVQDPETLDIEPVADAVVLDTHPDPAPPEDSRNADEEVLA
ncbi:hypothetical protein [Kineosporia sp. A_224]|uniref:hypothetical protein n=1 Tax=Kineosporia sp. A_224 TaxID=1962180 RepID=UPI000B4C0FCA|nr:hypothetical protein [Kineosporia sp. A_224]